MMAIIQESIIRACPSANDEEYPAAEASGHSLILQSVWASDYRVTTIFWLSTRPPETNLTK